MFDPAKLSPLPWALDEWADEIVDIDYVADNLSKDDAEFFVTARKCFDIGERREWTIATQQGLWFVSYNAATKHPPEGRLWNTCKTQAEAMALMIQADEWMTSQQGKGDASDE